jgi:hypothetical protein
MYRKSQREAIIKRYAGGVRSALFFLLMRLKRLVRAVWARGAVKTSLHYEFILFRVTRIELKTAQHMRIQVESLP